MIVLYTQLSEIENSCFFVKLQLQATMSSSQKVFNAMEAGDWQKVNEIIGTISWTPVDLEEKHGVQSYFYDLSADL